MNYMSESKFDGSLFGLVGHRVGCFIVTVCTLGLAYPWATCHMLRWKTMHTIIDGHRLTFDGKAIQLFGNWIKWILLTLITFGIYGFWLGIKLEQWKACHTHVEN